MIIERAKLQPITDSTWIVYSDNDKMGILNQTVQDHFTFIDGRVMLQFDDKKEVIQHFGNSHLFDQQIEAELIQPESTYIRGYRVSFASPILLEPGDKHYDPNLPLYLKKEGSNSPYAAGYYCLKFTNLGWIKVFNSKANTLKNYNYEGPFRTEADAKIRLLQLKAEAKKNDSRK